MTGLGSSSLRRLTKASLPSLALPTTLGMSTAHHVEVTSAHQIASCPVGVALGDLPDAVLECGLGTFNAAAWFRRLNKKVDV